MRTLLLCLALAGCTTATEPDVPFSELYTLVCVDSTLVHPTFVCGPDQNVYLILTITNPNPQP